MFRSHGSHFHTVSDAAGAGIVIVFFVTVFFAGALFFAGFDAISFGLSDPGCSAFSACLAAWNAAQRFFVASETAFLPSALIVRRLRFGGFGVAAGLAGPASIARSSARVVSMRRFWASKPSIAAEIISGVSFGIIGFRTSHLTAIFFARLWCLGWLPELAIESIGNPLPGSTSIISIGRKRRLDYRTMNRRPQRFLRSPRPPAYALVLTVKAKLASRCACRCSLDRSGRAQPAILLTDPFIPLTIR